MIEPNNTMDSEPWQPVVEARAELDLVAELESLAATETERFAALEKEQARATERTAKCLFLLRRGDAARRLAAVCQQVLREGWAFMDTDYLSTRSAEVLARDASLAPGLIWQHGFPCDSHWVKQRVAEALADVLLEDEELYSDGGAVDLGEDFHHQSLVHSFGIEPHRTLAASVRFHRLSERTRRSFFALLVEKLSVERCVAQGLGPRHHLRLEVREGLKALLFLEEHWPAVGEPQPNGEEGNHASF